MAPGENLPSKVSTRAL